MIKRILSIVFLLSFVVSFAQTSLILHTINSSSSPTVSNDGSHGFKPGHIWVNTSTKVSYQCVDTTSGAAQWLFYGNLGNSNMTSSSAARTFNLYDSTSSSSLLFKGATTGLFGIRGDKHLSFLANSFSPNSEDINFGSPTQKRSLAFYLPSSSQSFDMFGGDGNKFMSIYGNQKGLDLYDPTGSGGNGCEVYIRPSSNQAPLVITTPNTAFDIQTTGSYVAIEADSRGYFYVRKQSAYEWLLSGSYDSYVTAPVMFGSTSASSGQVQVHGPGSTSGTIDFKVENSSSANTVTMRGDNSVLFGGKVTLNHFAASDYEAVPKRQMDSSISANAGHPGVFIATASKTVSNDTSQKTLIASGVGSMTITGGTLAVGSTYRLILNGYIATAVSPPFVRFRVKIGSVTIYDTGSTAMFAVTGNQRCQLQVEFTVRAIGSGTSANVFAQGEFNYATSASTQEQEIDATNTSVSSGFDSTADQLIDATINWSAASSSNSITITNGHLEKLY